MPIDKRIAKASFIGLVQRPETRSQDSTRLIKTIEGAEANHSEPAAVLRNIVSNPFWRIVLWGRVIVVTDWNRRKLVAGFLGIGLGTGVATLPLFSEALQVEVPSVKNNDKDKEPEVSATEDLMREHGVIRRALLVYFEAVPKLRARSSTVDPAALHQTAQLFRTFGEDYHERMLEEQHIFPLIRKQGGELKRYADILTEQHNRGREITDYVLAVTNGPRIRWLIRNRWHRYLTASC